VSGIDDLIKRLRPNGVEFKRLGDVGEFIRGNGLQKSDLTDAGTPAIHYGQIHTYYGIWADVTKSFTAPSLAARLRRARPGDLIIATTSEDDEAVAKATAWIGNEEVAVSGDAYIYRHTLDPRYVAYFFQSGQFQEQKQRYITGTKVRRVSGDGLAKIRIPVPPVEVQRKIVDVLDLFGFLEAELKAELYARQLQYVHYRNLLVSFQKACTRWLPLGEIANVRVGQAPPAGMVGKEGPFAFVNAGTTESGRALEANTPGGAVTIPSRGQGGVGIVGYQTEDFWCGPLCYRIVSTDADLSTRFLYYYMKSIQPSIRGLQQTGGTPALNRKELVLVKVPTPPLQEQQRIVGILDKLDTLVNDPAIGMPAELKARRKQYEHYRDRLLTFQELAA
jgi:type I restriction enzyme, S subunit